MMSIKNFICECIAFKNAIFFKIDSIITPNLLKSTSIQSCKNLEFEDWRARVAV